MVCKAELAKRPAVLGQMVIRDIGLPAAGLKTAMAIFFPTHPEQERSLEERLGVGRQSGFATSK